MYRQPKIVDATPKEIHVDKLVQVFVTAKDDAPFWQPTPPPVGEDFEQYGIKCKFGRFGTSVATYVNKTTILCLTPNVKENYGSIS